MLQTSALYFPRADQLGDPFEGSLPRNVHAAREAQIAEIQARMPPGSPPWQWARGLDPSEPTKVLTVKSTFVSCWNLSEYENAALWSIYGKAVAIESTYRALRDSFANVADSVYIGRVIYIDYEQDVFPLDNGYHAIVHKRRFFENEQELRAVVPGKAFVESDDPNRETALPALLRGPVECRAFRRFASILAGVVMRHHHQARGKHKQTLC